MNHQNVHDIVNNIIAAVAFLGFFVFIVVYAAFANWRATPAGRALMYAIGSLNLMVLMATVHLFTGPYNGQQWVRTAVYSVLLGAAWWLSRTLIVTIRRGHPITVETFYQKKEARTMKEIFIKAQAYSKFLIAMLGAALAGGSLLIPEDWARWITFAITLLTAFSVYQVDNKTAAEVEQRLDTLAKSS